MDKRRNGAKRAGLARVAFLAAFLLCGAAAFAEVGMYVKGTVGYGFTVYDFATTRDGSWLKAKPAFGVSPWAGHQNVFLKGLSFEVSANLGFLNGYGNGNVHVMPGLMAVYTWQTAGRFSSHYGLGASFPIFIAGGQADPGFAVNILLGCGVAVTERVIPILELEGVMGLSFDESKTSSTGSNRSELGFDVRLGVVYKFGG